MAVSLAGGGPYDEQTAARQPPFDCLKDLFVRTPARADRLDRNTPGREGIWEGALGGQVRADRKALVFE